jgi:hypothetical protein
LLRFAGSIGFLPSNYILELLIGTFEPFEQSVSGGDAENTTLNGSLTLWPILVVGILGVGLVILAF